MARGRVVNEAQELTGLLKVLRQHGVSRFQRGPDGVLQVEFFVDGSAVAFFDESPPAPPTAVAPSPPASGEAPVQPAPSRQSFTALPSNDPLFDGVK